MATFRLQIVTPDGIAYDEDCTSLVFRASDGDLCIQPNHADFVTTVDHSEVKITNGDKTRYAACSNGFFNFSKNHAHFVATTFEFSEDIDLDRALDAKRRAEETLSNNKDLENEAILKAKLLRAITRINVANRD